ncbi:MAG: nucleoside-diphosphate kinase [Deltaproteobacteria bacterium]|nr:nucleoside-diphosphate kinase [Deltaproteobacteria bacterium]
MSKQNTLAILKPDTVAAGNAGKVISVIEDSPLEIVAMRFLKLSLNQAKGFYAVHKKRPFFKDLCRFMTSGPVVVMVLQGEDAIATWRDMMGPTNSKEAPKGTIRRAFGTDIERNAVHGSDAPETAAEEIGYFFPGIDLV